MAERSAKSRHGMVLLAGLCCLIGDNALADGGMPTDANGFMVGAGRLHPYVQVDTRFVTNPGYMPEDGPNDLVLVGRPGLELDLPSDTLELKLKGDLEWRQYLGIQNENTRNLSSLFATVGGDATINKNSALVVRLREKFLRTADPGNQTVSSRLLRISNDAGIGLDIRPGGGAIIISPDYTFFFERYDRDGNAIAGTGGYDPADLDNLRHIPKLRVAWKFFPKTAVFVEAEGQLTRYPSSNVNADANILLAYLGAAGSITQKIAVLLKAGYGNTFMSAANLGADQNFNSFVGQAEFNYLFSETMRLRAGVLRTVQPTSLFKFFEMLRGYVAYNQAFGRLQLDLNLGYNYLDYATAIFGPGGNRVDNNVTGDVTLSYQLNEWLTISGTNRLDLRGSNYTTQTGAAASYFSNDFFLRLSARY